MKEKTHIFLYIGNKHCAFDLFCVLSFQGHVGLYTWAGEIMFNRISLDMSIGIYTADRESSSGLFRAFLLCVVKQYNLLQINAHGRINLHESYMTTGTAKIC